MRFLRFAYTLLIFILLSEPAYSSVLDTKISISIHQEPLSAVLKQIEQRVGISFAYTNHVIKPGRLVTAQFKTISLGDLLKILLYDDGARFTAVESQIIIFAPRGSLTASPLLVEVRDTVRISIADTVSIYDTVSLTVADTTHIYDTVLVNVPRRLDLRRKKDNFAGLAAGLSYGTFALEPLTNQYLQLGQGQMQQYSAGIQLGQRAKYWEINTGAGIGISQSALPNTAYQYTPRTITDSVAYIQTRIDSSYITLPGIDTSWFTFETKTLAYRTHSRQQTDTAVTHGTKALSSLYLQIPVYVGFRTDITRKLAVNAGLQLMSNILLSSARDQMIGNDGFSIRLHPHPAYISGTVAAGMGYMLSKTIGMQLGATIGTWITPPVATDSISVQRSMQYGLKFSLNKYF